MGTLVPLASVWIFLLLSGAIVEAVPTIVSSPQTVQVNQGSTAVLRCRVRDLGSQEVVWTFVSHDFVIYEGPILMTSHPSKYTLLNAQDGSVYDLQILEVDLTDQGFYKCSAGPDEAIVSHVDVIEMEELPMPEVPDNINVTDCCVSKNVSERCLPACYPPDIDLDVFDAAERCGNALDGVNLMQCLTAGSNHDHCCLQRGVALECLPLCHNSFPTSLTATIVCFEDIQINALLSCAVQGADLFPSAPTGVTALAVNDGSPSILVRWGPPEKNAQAVTGYKIMYRPVGTATYSSVLIHDRSQLTYRLTQDGEDIMANQGYEIHLVALADHGISLGSIDLQVYIEDESLHQDLSESVDDCCQRRDVSASCRSSLCQSKTWSEFHAGNALDCFPFLEDIFHCLVGERNHTQCCAAYDVTSECWPLCSGTPPSFDSTLTGCVAQMGVIEACVQEGFKTLPVPPKELKVDYVTNRLAQISFKPFLKPDVTQYRVQVRARSKSEPFVDMKILDRAAYNFELEPLAENTYYWVRIVAETEDQGSLPSETVSFLTYSDSFEEPVERPTSLDPYNLMKCCEKTGMPLNCSLGCVYRANMTDYYQDHLAECYSSIGSVLACAADGRDHRECCYRRNIASPCEELCVHTKPGPLDSKYVPVCVPETSKAVLCYNEGLVRLPRYPTVVVTNVSINTITLSWTHPPSGSIVDSYNVTSMPVDGPASESKEDSTRKTSFIIQDLRPATEYTINVFSINENGTSAPSPDITLFTLEDVSTVSFNFTEEPTGRAFWQNITDCCTNAVPEQCRQICLNKESTVDQTNACFPQSLQMIACYADGQDHSRCCEERDLPSVCVPICGGNAEPSTVLQATCMSYTHRDIILSCFLERQGLIPEAPLSFSAARSDSADLNVTLSWNAPAFCMADCHYTVYYWNVLSPNSKMTQETTATDAVVAVPETDQRYTFMVLAHNSYGSGPPSAMQTLPVTTYERDVKVYLSGGGPTVRAGRGATLVCSIADFPQDISFLDVRWLFNNRKTVAVGRYLLIPSVDPHTDEGTYTCEVTDYFTTSSASFFLPVKALPTFDQLRDESAPPGVGSQAKVACWFRGFPDSDHYAWLKDGQPLTQDASKLSMTVDQRYHTGITSYKVKIANVVESDYGDYSISVSNEFGSSQCHVRLRNPEDIDDIGTAPAVSNPPACCAREGVTPLCQDLCGFHINIEDVIDDGQYITCLQYFDTFIKCGADGRDHTKCCQDTAVLPFCQPMCRGVVPASVISDQEKLLGCLGEWQPITACLQVGSKRLPFSPLNISLSVMSDGRRVAVMWSQPLVAADKIDHYTIYYRHLEQKVTKHVAVNEQVQRYVLTDLEPMTFYHVWMTSGNKHGSSLPSPEKELETFTYTLNKPYNVTAVHVPDTADIRLTWFIKRLQYYYSFTVHYKELGDDHFMQIHNIHGTMYTLSGLKPRTTYEAYIEGMGPVKSQGSTLMEFSTLGGAKAGTQSDDGGTDAKKIAIGVGVTVAIIAFIAIVLLIVFFVIKSRLVPDNVNDTVAFENPGFGSSGQVKLHGLGDGDFNYGQLEEEGGSGLETGVQQHVYDNAAFAGTTNNNASVLGGESSSDPPAYDNQMYQQANVSVEPTAAGRDSVATLELNNSGS